MLETQNKKFISTQQLSNKNRIASTFRLDTTFEYIIFRYYNNPITNYFFRFFCPTINTI